MRFEMPSKGTPFYNLLFLLKTDLLHVISAYNCSRMQCLSASNKFLFQTEHWTFFYLASSPEGASHGVTDQSCHNGSLNKNTLYLCRLQNDWSLQLTTALASCTRKGWLSVGWHENDLFWKGLSSVK